MLELIFCACFTILPDYLIKRYAFNKRWGKEINLFSVWYELRWGISACIILTISLISLIFYYHPTTTNVTPMFRTVTILPETNGRVENVYVENFQVVKKGDPIFSLEDSSEKAEVETARKSLDEIAAQKILTQASLKEAEANITTEESKLEQARDDFARAVSIVKNGGRGAISERNLKAAESLVAVAEAELAAAQARRDEVLAELNTLLPARQETAEAELQEAEIDLAKTVIYAEIDGRITQFTLQPGDIVNPMFRPAGIIVPTNSRTAGTSGVQAGFNQLASPVLKPGTVAEMTCLSKPFKIIPMVVTDVQMTIASGQLRPSDQMLDLQERAKPGTLTVRLEPLYPDGLDGVLPGSKCIANGYTNNHELIESGELTTSEFIYYHVVDTVGIVHALLLRIQALIIPVQSLVFSGH